MNALRILRLACLLLVALSAVVQAQLTFTTNNGAITITGYTGSPTNLIIPSMTNGYPVTTIGNSAFGDQSTLTSVTIPGSVTNIGTFAFACPSLTNIAVDAANPSYASAGGVLFNANITTLVEFPRGLAGSYTIPNSVTDVGIDAFSACEKMTNITIGPNVTSLETYALGNCTNLVSVTIPNNVTNIGINAFGNCKGLKSATIGNGVVSIGNYVFAECRALTNVTIGTNLTFISSYAFYFCTALSSITLPNSVVNVEDVAFASCSNLTTVMLGNNVTNIGGSVFESCVALRSITIPDSVISIGRSAFFDCFTLAAVTIGTNVTTLGDAAFVSCSNLTSLTIPNGVTSIGAGAFEYCVKLAAVTISNGVTSIGDNAFENCSGLTSVTIPSSITNIGTFAFRFCSHLRQAYFMGNAPGVDGGSGSLDGTVFSGDSGTAYYLPDATGWGATFGSWPAKCCFTYTTNNGTITITGYTGPGGNVTIPNAINGYPVTAIGSELFEGQSTVTSVTIPNSVISIGLFALYCKNLGQVYFEGNEPTGYGLFEGTSGTVYYLPGTTGWGTLFAGWRTASWYQPQPLILATTYGFGASSNGFQFTISWATNASVIVAACTNLSQPVWTPLATNPLVGGTNYFSDPQWTNYPGRFYRISSQ